MKYIIVLILFLYIIFISNNVPNNYKILFNNNIFKTIIIILITLYAEKHTIISILLTICFILTLYSINTKDFVHNINKIEQFTQLDHFNNQLDTTQNIE
jgi:hypothetical protein